MKLTKLLTFLFFLLLPLTAVMAQVSPETETKINWPVIASLFGGGAMGAIITYFVTERRNRKQPIVKKKELTPVFIPGQISDKHQTVLTLSGSTAGTETFHYSNLYLSTFELKNVGNKDFDKFNFEFSARSGVKVVNVVSGSLASQHEVVLENEVSFGNPQEKVRVKLDPFNRQEVYSIQFFLTSEYGEIKLEDIDIDTKLPIVFVEPNETSKKAVSIMKEVLRHYPVRF